MKSERELRKLLALINESLKQDTHCPGCKSCYVRKVQAVTLAWILDGDSELDRAIEELTADVARRG